MLPPADLATPAPDDFELCAFVIADVSSPETLSGWRIGETLDVLPASDFEWVPVGYDVCDEVGYSGLTNCAPHDAAERESLARKWAPVLNGLHLFDDLPHADAFRIELNARAAEHAPFLVHRLYVARRDAPVAT